MLLVLGIYSIALNGNCAVQTKLGRSQISIRTLRNNETIVSFIQNIHHLIIHISLKFVFEMIYRYNPFL